MNIYVASSWRNQHQPAVVRFLRLNDHTVYDFRHPAEGDDGFAWSEIDPDWENWDAEQFVEALDHPLARSGFLTDSTAMGKADACVLVLPCGRSAHLEAGWFVGQGKPLIILLIGPNEPELMYRIAYTVVGAMDLHTALTELGQVVNPIFPRDVPDEP